MSVFFKRQGIQNQRILQNEKLCAEKIILQNSFELNVAQIQRVLKVSLALPSPLELVPFISRRRACWRSWGLRRRG